MKGNPVVIQLLNDILMGELTAINQYFLHSRMCKSFGYARIADKMYHESIEEMKHASDLTDRILFLEGIPNLQALGKLNIGETVLEQLESDMRLELEAIDKMRNAIVVCYDAKDHTSKDLIEKILREEEEHVDWLEAQLGIIKDIGLQNYLAQQLHG